MKKRQLGKQMFSLHISSLFILIILSVYLLLLVFIKQINHTIWAYLIYTFSTYTLITFVVTVFHSAIKIKQKVHQNPFFNRYFTDLNFKAKISLYLSLGINIVYSFYKVSAGIYYHSLWFGTVAFYYIVLSVQRFFLLYHIRKKDRNYILELKKYCLCGYLLLTLTIAVIGMNVYLIHEQQTIIYPGYMIYAMAGYTFYNLIVAVMNTVRYRTLEKPIYHASKMIALATALVSLFSLQIAMFAEFGKNDVQQRIMNTLTGFGVLIIIIVISLLMIIRGKYLLRNYLETNI